MSKITIENEPKEQEEAGVISKPIQFVYPDPTITRFSNYALVQRDNDSFVLTFFDVHKPAFIGPDEEKKKQIEKIESIPAFCIARIVLTPDHFKRLVLVLQKHLERFEKSPDI